jgi:hypothetical protein
MSQHLFLPLLLFLLLLSLAWLWHFSGFHHGHSFSKAVALHTAVQRLLKPRSPHDCPACCLAPTLLSAAGSMPVRLWCEVKSRRGAPKRVNTEGFACPNQQCPFFGMTDAHMHALVGDGKHGCAERIQMFRGPACRTPFSARRHTPLYRLKTPSHQIAKVLSALAEGPDASAAERVFGYRQATITSWLTRAGGHAEIFHERCFRNLHLPHLQLDEIRTRLRSCTQVLWLWLAIDPRTKILPVLHLGSRTQHAAHLLIHSLRQLLAPDCLPLFTSDGLNLYFYAAPGSFWTVARSRASWAQSPSMAGSSGSDLRSGEEKLPTAEADTGLACDAPWNRGRSQGHVTAIRLLWTIEHGFY